MSRLSRFHTNPPSIIHQSRRLIQIRSQYGIANAQSCVHGIPIRWPSLFGALKHIIHRFWSKWAQTVASARDPFDDC
jgi:hypothetical protein